MTNTEFTHDNRPMLYHVVEMGLDEDDSSTLHHVYERKEDAQKELARLKAKYPDFAYLFYIDNNPDKNHWRKFDVDRNEYGDELVVGCANCGEDVTATDDNGNCSNCKD
jgi:hypothetical protein